MEKKENFAMESFWKEALKADSVLMWIVFNIRHYQEDRALLALKDGLTDRNKKQSSVGGQDYILSKIP